MKNGIYHVRFHSNSQAFGEGLVVLKEGSVNGGDHGYLYRGRLDGNGEAIKAHLTISQWNQGVRSVFGPLKEYTLDLSGSSHGDSFECSGGSAEIPGAAITISGRKISDAS